MLAFDTDALVHWAMKGAPWHRAVRQIVQQEIREKGERIALTSQVCWEFLHIVTDGKRFARPFSMDDAIVYIRELMGSAEVVSIDAGSTVVYRVLELLQIHSLGRKRILDTVLAATLESHHVTRLVTLNGDDFRVFKFLDVLDPRCVVVEKTEE